MLINTSTNVIKYLNMQCPIDTLIRDLALLSLMEVLIHSIIVYVIHFIMN